MGGIAFSIFLYGNLFYWGVVAKTGPYAAMKVQLTEQLMNSDAGQIALYKATHGVLPQTLDDVASETSKETLFLKTDAWINTFRYTPQSDGHFQLTSAGADGVFGTADDIQKSF